MSFFKKTSVAVLLTVLIVALCCVWGYTRAYLSNQGDTDTTGQSQRAGESNLNYFLNWIDDGANLFTMETTDTLARDNLDMSNTYGTMVAVKTVNYLNGEDIETYSKNLFEEVSLGSKDMMLVIESSNRAWYLVYGGGLRSYADGSDSLVALLQENLDDEFFQGYSNEGILALFRGMEDWCQETLPVRDTGSVSGNPFLEHGDKVQILSLWDILRGILFTLLVNIWWIILLLVVLNLADRYRLHQYIRKYPPGTLNVPPVLFRPILFWHRPGSAWYERMVYLFTEGPFEEEEGFDGDSQEPGAQADGAQEAPGPDVGPDAADAQWANGSGSLWNNLWGLAWETVRSVQLMIRRFLRGGRM